MAYVLYDPMVSYTQGMTDLLAPLLASLEDEVMAFWCFTKLVERSVFFKPCSVSISMENQLVCLLVLSDLLSTIVPGTIETTDRTAVTPILRLP